MINKSDRLKIQSIYRKEIEKKQQNENLSKPKLILLTVLITVFFFLDANINWF